ncbi:MAG: CAP domain-containing protein [Gemmatimonadetes bacterium]|nr:CAP domain-containing protein [Gemmatimonadota bacterium]
MSSGGGIAGSEWGRGRGLCLALVSIGWIGLFLPAQSAAQPADGSSVSRALSSLHDLVNERRRDAGCEPLQWHEPTARVAEAHSADMFHRDFFDHLTPDGRDLYRRLISGGVRWRGVIAENIALTVRGSQTVIDLWMESPPHRANIEDCTFTHEGLGLFRDRWTQVLVERPRG